MGIQKEQFYEGAALQILARSGLMKEVLHEPPFYLLNGRLRILVKYSTRGRSPWGFSFTSREQRFLAIPTNDLVIGLVCGSDGIAAVTVAQYSRLATDSVRSPIHIACYRRFKHHYEVRGPGSSEVLKVAPVAWSRVLGTTET